MLSILLAGALAITPAYSGSWFGPERSGEGFTLQILDGKAHALWFTYPPAGSEAQQAWIYAQDGVIDGDTVRFTNTYTTRGPKFGAQYDPAALQLIPWGTLEFRFSGCNSGQVTFSGPQGWGSGGYAITRLTALSELECTGKRQLSANGTRLIEGMRSRSGSWFDPAHNGEGWQVEELPDGRTQVYWFTYDARGEQAWTIGVSPTSGANMTITDNLRPVGAHFGTAFNPADVRRESWGRLELDLTGCLQGGASYSSTQAGFGSGTLRPARITVPAAAVCVEGTPSRPSSLSWTNAASMPRAQSEAGRAIIGSQSFIAGGFPETRSFQRYDATTNAWTALPDMPGGRDHALALGLEGVVYVAGGNPGAGDQSSSGWRYIPGENRWESVPQLPAPLASGAASLAGYGWFASVDGSLTQFDPRTFRTRAIPGDNRAPRDHSQLVAFGGELWLIGGRNTRETGAVSIFDPASETWRAGPTLRVARGGFAAAASDTLLVVAGGEVLFGTPAALGDVEAIAAGESAWHDMPPLPTHVHGVTGMLDRNAFYVFGGSTQAGGVANVGDVQVGTFQSTNFAFATRALSAAPGASVNVTVVRNGSASGAFDVPYNVRGESCATALSSGSVRFEDGETAKTIGVSLRNVKGTCNVGLVPSEIIGTPQVIVITTVPVVAGCPAPSNDIVYAQLAGPGNTLLQRQRSGQVLVLDLPTLSSGASGQIAFGESAGGASTPTSVTLEVSITRCPGVIDPDTANRCNLRSSISSFNSLQWLFKPSGTIVDAASANQRGACWAVDNGPFYVNARWTYRACALNAETCGFAIQYNPGGF
jgi:Kelch motif protein